MLQPSRLSFRRAAGTLALLAAGLLAPPLAAQPNAAILYEQNGPPSGNGIPDQNFEAGMDEFDSLAADDFEVTGEWGWDVSMVRTVGTADGATPTKVDVHLYANSPGGGHDDLPGAVVCSYPQLTPATFPNLELALPAPCHLPPGRYWLGIQVDQRYEDHGQHFWSNTRVRVGHEAVWSNPGNGFERDCRSFRPQTQCLVGGANNPDLIFQILGVETPPPTTDLVLELEGDLPPSSFFARYELKLTNHGPLDATGVTISQNLPAGCVFEQDSCGGDSTDGWRWDLGTLASGAAADCEIVCDVSALPGGEPITATASATADQLITNPAATTAQVELITGPLPAIPVTGAQGLAILALLLAAAGAFLLRR